MDYGLSVLKWMLIVRPKIPLLIVWPICPIGPKVWDIVGKRLTRASIVHGYYHQFSDDYVKTVNKQITMAVPVIFQLCSRIMMCKTCSSEISVFSFFLPSLLLKESKTRILRQMATRFKSFPINIHEIVYWKWQWLL